MKAMVKTYSQMSLQLFHEPHTPRTKSAILTNFRMRLGYILRHFTITFLTALYYTVVVVYGSYTLGFS